MSSASSAGKGAESGNATVGFVTTLGLLLVLAYTIIALALGWYVHAIAVDSAIEGARVGTLGGTDAAVARTRDLMTTTLSSSYANNVSAEMTPTHMEVTVWVPIPGAGFLGERVIEVRALAARE